MSKSVLIDSSLLVLLVAGHVDRGLIGRHKNLSQYDEDWFDLLQETLREFSSIVLTPNTLTEASNLLRQIGDPDRRVLTLALHQFIQENEEQYVQSRDASKCASFARLGLTDAAIMKACRDDIVLLTVDVDLYLAAQRAGLSASNLAHLYDRRFS